MSREPRYRTVAIEDRPDASEMKPWRLYVVGSTEHPFCAAMLCPCGCNEALYMSLVEDDDPRWRVKVYADATATMVPSVWRVVGCRSHFILFRGRVLWVRSYWDRRRL